MKKLYYIILAVLATIVGVGMLLFNKNEATRIPKSGIYFIPQNSFYALNSIEDINIALDFYEVSKNDYSERYIDKCGEFSLVSDIGKEYSIDVDKDNISDENRDTKISKNLIARKYKMNISNVIDENIRIVGIKFKDEKNRLIYRDIGSIEFYISTDLQGDLSFSSNRIDWESFVQPTFNRAELIVSNEEKHDIEIIDILYGHTGIEAKDDTMFKIQTGGNKTVVVNIDLKKEKKGEPIIYYLKPIVKYTCNNDIKEVVCDSINKEAYYGTTKEIKEYLYKISRECEK